MLTAAVARLPTRCRQVFTLRKVYGLSQKEIAAELNISENTVEQHLAKGMRLCSAALANSPMAERRSPWFERSRRRAERPVNRHELIEARRPAAGWRRATPARDASPGSRSSIAGCEADIRHRVTYPAGSKRPGDAAIDCAICVRSIAASIPTCCVRRAAAGRWPLPPRRRWHCVVTAGSGLRSAASAGSATRRASAASRASCSMTAASST